MWSHIAMAVLVCAVFLGGCHVPYRGHGTVPTRASVWVATQQDGSECIPKGDAATQWAKGTPGATRVWHRRWVRIRVESDPYYRTLPYCEAEEEAGSSSGEPYDYYPHHHHWRRW